MSYEIVTRGEACWVNITDPTPENIDRLEKEFPQFHPLALEDTLSLLERPKIDDYDDHLFLVMQFPLWDASRRVSRPEEIDIFVGKNFVVTIHTGKLPPMKKLWEAAKHETSDTEEPLLRRGGRLFHKIIDELVDYLLPMMSSVDNRIRELETQIFEEDARKVLRDLSFARRDLIALRRILRPQVGILANLENTPRAFIYEELDDYFGDVLDHLTKVRDIVEENYEVIVSLADTADALASHRINEVMRILTVFSVIMLPLTLITGIFGMNVPLPFQNKAVSLIGVISLMIAISIGMLFYFRHKRWL